MRYIHEAKIRRRKGSNREERGQGSEVYPRGESTKGERKVVGRRGVNGVRYIHEAKVRKEKGK